MKLLLDTHALIWWLAGDNALSLPARAAIADSKFRCRKRRIGNADQHQISPRKLPQAAVLAQDFETIIAAQGFSELAITFRHARTAGAMNITLKTLLTAC